jgi:hypothetical protein
VPVAMLLAGPAAVMVIAVVARGMTSVTIVVAASVIVMPTMVAIPVTPPVVTVVVAANHGCGAVALVNHRRTVIGMVAAAFGDATRRRQPESSHRSHYRNEFQSH